MSVTCSGLPHGPRGTFRAGLATEVLPWLGLLLAVAAFLADLLLPLGVSVGVCYVLSVLTTYGHPRRYTTAAMASLVSVLTVLALAGSAERTSPLWVVAVNRGLALATIWGTAAFLSTFSGLARRLRQTEIEVRARRAWLAQTLASIGDGVIATDAAGRIEFMNDVAARLTGWPEIEAVNRPVEEVFDIRDEDTGERAENPVKKVLAQGAVVGLDKPIVLRSRNGETWPLDDSAAPIRDDKGQVSGVVMVFREVSERRKDEQQMALRLREAGHRIKNVFTNVHAMLSMCERATETPAELVQCVQTRLASLLRSTERLMHATEAGSSLRRIVVEEVAPYLEKGGDHLHFSGADVLLEPHDAVSFGMIVHELATNAAKYGSLTSETGRVEVDCEQPSDGRIVLVWSEVGGPAAAPPARRGLGTQLIEGLVKTQFSGAWEADYGAAGFRCRLELDVRRGTADGGRQAGAEEAPAGG